MRDALHAGAVGRLCMAREARAVHVLVGVRLHGADLVHRLVDVGRDVGHAVLARRATGAARAGRAAGSAAASSARHQHEQRELPAGDEQHQRGAGHHQAVANEHRQPVADDLLQQRGVVGEARHDLAGARGLEERGLEPQQMVEHRAPQVGHHALAHAHHEIEAHPGRGGVQHHHRDHRGKRLVEQVRIAAAEAAVHHVLQAAAEREHATGRDQQSAGRQRDAPAIGPQKARQAGEARQLHRPKKPTWLRPSWRARYLAASALRSSASPSPPSAG